MQQAVPEIPCLTCLQPCASQVTDALNQGTVTSPETPYDLIRTLLHSRSVMAELRSFVASGSGAHPVKQANVISNNCSLLTLECSLLGAALFISCIFYKETS